MAKQMKADPRVAKEFVPPWVAVRDVAHMFGMNYQSAKRAISQKTFPAPTYRVGIMQVIDRDVLDAYFMQKKAAGMLQLKTPQKKLRTIRR